MTTTKTPSERGRANRNKGATAERDLCRWLRSNGFSGAERAVRTGFRTADRVSADPGDITGTPGIVWSGAATSATATADTVATTTASAATTTATTTRRPAPHPLPGMHRRDHMKCRCGKYAFPDKRTADRVVIDAKLRRYLHSATHRREERSYRCPIDSRWWHVTSHEQKTEPREAS